MTTRATDSANPSVTVPVPPADVIPPEVHETAARLGVAQHLPRVIDLTREIFGTFLRVTVSEDPEYLGDDHIIFHVPPQSTIEEDLDKSKEWGRHMQEIIPRSPQVYLAIPEFSS